jgi:hypothetical protein
VVGSVQRVNVIHGKRTLQLLPFENRYARRPRGSQEVFGNCPQRASAMASGSLLPTSETARGAGVVASLTSATIGMKQRQILLLLACNNQWHMTSAISTQD